MNELMGTKMTNVNESLITFVAFVPSRSVEQWDMAWEMPLKLRVGEEVHRTVRALEVTRKMLLKVVLDIVAANMFEALVTPRTALWTVWFSAERRLKMLC